MSLSSCKAELALSTLNLCHTLPGHKVQKLLLPLVRPGQIRVLEARSFCGGRKKKDGKKSNAQRCFAAIPPAFRREHGAPAISFSNCSHVLLLKNLSPHLLRAGWSRGIWKRSPCLPLASSPCVQLHSDTMSCPPSGMQNGLPPSVGEKRVTASEKDAYFCFAVFHKSLLAMAESTLGWM